MIPLRSWNGADRNRQRLRSVTATNSTTLLRAPLRPRTIFNSLLGAGLGGLRVEDEVGLHLLQRLRTDAFDAQEIGEALEPPSELGAKIDDGLRALGADAGDAAKFVDGGSIQNHF